MCGIIGILSDQASGARGWWQALKRLEYRGYDLGRASPCWKPES